jgi:hypothetical protein
VWRSHDAAVLREALEVMARKANDLAQLIDMAPHDPGPQRREAATQFLKGLCAGYERVTGKRATPADKSLGQPFLDLGPVFS